MLVHDINEPGNQPFISKEYYSSQNNKGKNIYSMT